MPLRLGPGPVFVYEWITTSRRWQAYALRAAFIGAILIGLCFVWSQLDRYRPVRARASLADLARYGEAIYRTIAIVELTLVLLAAPAATAGAVCLDKARGTLDHMLTTDLSSAEIVLGKLGVRLVPVLGLIACVVPVVALTSMLGGIDPLALIGLFLTAIGCALVTCSLAMTLSVYGRKTHEVLILAYLLIVVWVAAPILMELASWVLAGQPRRILPPVIWDGIEWSNPYVLAFAPYDMPSQASLGAYVNFLGGSLLASAALAGLATARVRGVALSQAGRPAAGGRLRLLRRLRPPSPPRLPGPSLEGNPVAWREWHRSRPSLMMRIAWGIYAALGLLGVWLAVQPSSAPGSIRNEQVGMVNMFLVAVGLLLLSAGASTSLAEERVRGSLDVLLSTPLPTRSIVAGKWWGGFRRASFLAAWPAATAFILAYDGGYWSLYALLLALVIAQGAAMTSLGLAAATWIARPGRAVAACVSAYVVFVVGWPILVLVLHGPTDSALLTWLMVADPPFGALFGTMCASSNPNPLPGSASRNETALFMIVWILANVALAALLFRLTTATFDDRMGRIPDDGARPTARRPGRSSLSQAELLALVPSASGIREEDFEAEDE